MRFPNIYLLFFIFLALYARSLNQTHPFPIYDEADYLDMSRDFSRKGLPGIAHSYVSGANTISTRQPLYLWNLSWFLDESPADFARGKLLSLAHAFLLIGGVYFFSRKRWGEPVALTAAAAAGFSPTLLTLSHSITADVSFALFYFAALMVITEKNDHLKNWALFGILTGLAYLTKGNGYFLFFSALAVGLWKYKTNFFVRPYFYLALGTFTAVSFLLLYRNILVWKNPFYHYNNKVFWLDSWTQAVQLQNTPAWETINALWYFKNHTLLQALERIIRGISRTFEMLIQSLAIGPQHFASMIVSGSAIFLLAIYGLAIQWKKKQAVEFIGLTTTSSILFVAFIWGSGGDLSHVRYLFPFAVTLFPMAALGAIQLWKSKIKLRFHPWILPSLIIAGSLGIITANRQGLTINPLTTWSVSSNWKKTSLWLYSHADANGTIFDNFSVYTPWDGPPIKMVPYPFNLPEEILLSTIQKRNIRYALVDTTLINGDPFKQKYGPSDEFGPTTFLGWPRCFHGTQKPSTFIIYSPTCP